jgi:hypothetical protein
MCGSARYSCRSVDTWICMLLNLVDVLILAGSLALVLRISKVLKLETLSSLYTEQNVIENSTVHTCDTRVVNPMSYRPPSSFLFDYVLSTIYVFDKLIFTRIQYSKYVGVTRARRIQYRGLNVKVGVFILLLFASIPDCRQNQTAVSGTQRLLSDF